MPSTFFGLNTAYTGLIAANAALNTTANNISNVETDGYSRQTVTQKASDAIRTYTTYGCAGAGVDTVSIDRNRDAFYDFKYWNNNQKLGEYEEKQYYMQQVEDLFTDDTTIKGFVSIFNEMYNSLEELQKNAGDTTTRSQFIGYANNLAYYFNTVSENLESIQIDINSEIKNKVDEINSYAAEISSLNQQINVIELTGTTANELRDQRDLLIDKLSQIVSVEVTETPIYDSNNANRDTGANRYTVQIAGGQMLVDSGDYYELECVARASYEANNQSDALGLFDIKWKNGNDFSMSSTQIGGELQGLIEMRDGNNGENFKGTVSAVERNATTGKNEVTIDVTADYLQDLNKCTLPDNGGIIQIGNQEFYFDSFSVVYGADGKISQYVFEISDDLNKNSIQPNASRIGKDASVGSSIDYQGVPYYMEQINEWVRTFAEAFNNILTQDDAVDGYGNEADVLFVANEATDVTQRKFLDARNAGTSATIDSTADTYYYLTASNFAISKEMMNDPQLLATHTGAGTGQEAYDVVEDLIALRTDKSVMSFRGCNAGEFLQCILSDISLNASSANTFYDSYQNISNTIDTQRLSISGVDTDEEALNLVQYQHAYNLASQMIQVLTEVYDRLILETGV
jgi:flagellar hook-associated protein 1 FlgK